MNKEQQELLDEAYKRFLYECGESYGPYGVLLKSEFINKCENDPEFSKTWGIKIEERELSEIERMIIAGYDYRNVGGIGWNIIKATVDVDNSMPKKLITITYNDKTIESYE